MGYVRLNAMVPVPDVPDWESLNARLLSWCEQKRQQRLEARVADQAALRAFPDHPFRCSITRMLKVNALSLVHFFHDLAFLTEDPVLAPQALELLALGGGQAASFPGVDLRPAQPAAEGGVRNAQVNRGSAWLLSCSPFSSWTSSVPAGCRAR
ncbi:MAG: hypothetical protein AB1609_18300 [Bacillota bacterium]